MANSNNGWQISYCYQRCRIDMILQRLCFNYYAVTNASILADTYI